MLNKMASICDNEYDYFFSYPNVNGVAIGNKIINGVDTGVPCLTVLTTQKIPAEDLKQSDKIPKQYQGILTDVVEIGEITPFFNTSNKGYIRPVEGGYSGSPYQASGVGTLGGLVSNGTGSALSTYILSNNHVLAETNTDPIGTPIIQPGVGDGPDTLANQVATLSDYVPIDFSVGNQNIVDCAIAELINNTIAVPTIVDIGVPTGISSAIIGNFVQKSGRTSGYETGTITNINATTNVNYGAQGVATFVKQILSTNIGIPGDSGSWVLDNQNRVVGLLFAGTPNVVTVMNDIRYVLQSYRARLVG